MAWANGNSFWKLRTKHGRDRVIQDYVKLREDIEEYFCWCDENPILITELFNVKGEGIVEHDKPVRRPFQKEALANALGLSEWRYIADLKNVSDDFSQVIMWAERTIYSQKFEGATVGQFNSNIIARDLGLVDKREDSLKANINLVDKLFPPIEELLADEEES